MTLRAGLVLRFAGVSFGHHNRHFAGYADALSAAMNENARQHPAKRLDVVRVLEDHDLVADHSRVQHGPDDRGHALVHIFRFEAGQVAELWDLAIAVPADSPHEHGMF